MSINNHAIVGTALGLLHQGLYPYVKNKLITAYSSKWIEKASFALPYDSFRSQDIESVLQRDVSVLLIITWNEWNNVFDKF